MMVEDGLTFKYLVVDLDEINIKELNTIIKRFKGATGSFRSGRRYYISYCNFELVKYLKKHK